MFSAKTLFVIGAGASCEAGLPSGEALKKKIASLLDIRFEDGWNQNSGDRDITQALRNAVIRPDGQRGDINPLLHKAWRIRDVVPAAAISIDNFLDAHQGDEEIELCGKLGIVKSILDAESQSRLRPKERGDEEFSLKGLADTWYVRFFQMLTENVARRDVETLFDNVTIITFNYDRCIERFLVQALKEYYDLEIEEAIRFVGRLRIYHPYGTVGPLPWQDRNRAVPFGSNRADLLAAARRIKTFTEGMDDDELIGQIHNAVMDAETLVFLGFAFHPMNMRLLTPGDIPSVRKIFASTLGLSKADEAVIQNDIFQMLRVDLLAHEEWRPPVPEMAQTTASEFFKQYFRSMSAPA